MKKRKLIILLSLLLAFAALTVFAGCSSTVVTVPDDYESVGYQRVFFYYNGGIGKVDNPYAMFFVDKGGRLPTPMKDNSYEVGMPTCTGYDFYGWYQIDNERFKDRKQDMVKEGQVVYDSKGETVKETVWYVAGHDFLNEEIDEREHQLTPTDVEENEDIFIQRDNNGNIREWNFDFDRVTGDTTIIALWRTKRKYVLLPPEYKYEDPDAKDFEARTGLVKQDCVYDGSILAIKRTEPGLPERKGYQIEGFYLDRQYTTPISFTGPKGRYYPSAGPNDYNADGELKTVCIYINWLEDRYTIVESSGDIPKESSGGVTYHRFHASGSYYFKENVDLEGFELRNPDEFSGEIEGNGHALYNFRIDINQNIPGPNEKDIRVNYGGIFNKLSAKVKNISFEGITYNFFHVDPSQIPNPDRGEYINAFAKEIAESSEIKNVNVGSDARPAVWRNILQNVKNTADYTLYYVKKIVDGQEVPQPVFVDGLVLSVPIKYSPLTDGNGRAYWPKMRQVGVNFAGKNQEDADDKDNIITYSKNVVNGCNATVTWIEWQSEYEMYIDENTDHRNLPKFSDILHLKFYGWCNADGVKIDPTRDLTSQDYGMYYAMWLSAL